MSVYNLLIYLILRSVPVYHFKYPRLFNVSQNLEKIFIIKKLKIYILIYTESQKQRHCIVCCVG